MTNKLTNFLLALILLSVVFLAALYLISDIQKVFSSAPPGSAVSNGNVTYVEIGRATPTSVPTLLFTRTTNCLSRIITTGSSTLRLLMASSSVAGFATSSANLNAGRGLIQAASTTEHYDAGIYGCDFWAATNYEGSTTVTAIENF